MADNERTAGKAARKCRLWIVVDVTGWPHPWACGRTRQEAIDAWCEATQEPHASFKKFNLRTVKYTATPGWSR